MLGFLKNENSRKVDTFMKLELTCQKIWYGSSLSIVNAQSQLSLKLSNPEHGIGTENQYYLEACWSLLNKILFFKKTIG
jgi:hypothetical protein